MTLLQTVTKSTGLAHMSERESHGRRTNSESRKISLQSEQVPEYELRRCDLRKVRHHDVTLIIQAETSDPSTRSWIKNELHVGNQSTRLPNNASDIDFLLRYPLEVHLLFVPATKLSLSRSSTAATAMIRRFSCISLLALSSTQTSVRVYDEIHLAA